VPCGFRVVGNPYLITLRQSCPTRNATMRLYGSLVGAPKLCLLCEVVVVLAFIKPCANKRHTSHYDNPPRKLDTLWFSEKDAASTWRPTRMVIDTRLGDSAESSSQLPTTRLSTSVQPSTRPELRSFHTRDVP
jgi:hypothetical protein